MNNLYINLNIISKIKPNEKIYINSDGFISIEQSNMFQGIIRFIFNNSRSKSINNLSNFYNTLYIHINQLLSGTELRNINKYNDSLIRMDFNRLSNNTQSTLDSLGELLKYLQSSIMGLENLKKTYGGDVYIVSVLDLIIADVNTYIKKINNCIKTF